MKRNLLLGFCLLLVGVGYAQTTDIPDDNFEQALIDLGIDSNPTLDNLILTSAISGITDLDISNQGIRDLTGLEDFTSLENLNVSENNLDELVLQNLSLVTIRAFNCNLAGKPISFQNNPPSGSFLTNVIFLSLADNGIGTSGSTISFGGVPNLEGLDISGNNFGTVALNETVKITSLRANDCPNLSALTSINLLTDLNTLTIQNCNFTTLNLDSNTELRTLNIADNNFSLFDLNPFKALTGFVTANNAITALDFTENVALATVAINNSAISQLDFSSNTKLVFVNVFSNANLSSLNLANGTNAIINTLLAQSTALDCIQVDDVTQAENAAGWGKDTGAVYLTNCNALNNRVEVSITPNQALDADGNYVISAGTTELFIAFDLEDENGNEVASSTLASYNLQVSTLEHPSKNKATGGTVPSAGVDFELISNEVTNITTANGAIDGTRRVAIGGDGIFEGDEFFQVEVRSTDPNISLKDAVNGAVLLPVRIIDNEVTNVNLEIVTNGIEGSQDVRLRIRSSLANNTGAPMPFAIALQNGTATNGTDFELANNIIQLPNGQSSVEFDITVNPDTFNLEGIENFTATVSYTGDIDTNRVNIVNGTVTPTITNSNTAFTVNAVIGGGVENLGGLCCPEYEFEEGQVLEIEFDAEENAPIDSEYIIEIVLTYDSADEDDLTIEQPTPDSQVTYTVKTTAPDNILRIFINEDFSTEPGGERLELQLNPVGDNFILTGDTTFKINIKDKEPIQPFTVSTTLTGAGTEPNYVITEGDSFELNFDTGATGTNDVTYSPIITITKDGQETSADFSIDDINSVFTIRTATPDGFIVFTANEDSTPEEDETYTITLTSEDTNRYTMLGTTTFTIQVKDKEEVDGLFDVQINLGGDVVNLGDDENPNYQINEGGTLLMTIEALNGPDYNRNYFILYTDNLSEIPNDFSRNFEIDERNFIGLEPDEIANPDNTYSLQIINDNSIDGTPEEIQLSFENNLENLPEFKLNGLGANEALNFTITIIDVDNTSSEVVFADFTNSGGTEGGTDTFTIALTEGGNPWVNNTNQDIVFPVVFTNQKLDGTTTALAEVGDYAPTTGAITIAPNSSSGSLVVNLTEDVDKEHEFYVATLGNPTSSVTITKLNNAIQAKIIDKEALFEVYARVKQRGASGEYEGDALEIGSPCCPLYKVEEGQKIEIALEAEKGVQPQAFNVGYGFSGAAMENSDFTNLDIRAPTLNNEFEYAVSLIKNPDNFLQMQVTIDTDYEEDIEQLYVNLYPVETDKFKIPENQSAFEFVIYNVLPVSVVATENMANEEDPDTSKGKFTLSLPVATNKSFSVNYEISGDAKEGKDFATIARSVFFDIGDQSKDIDVMALPDDFPEENETIRLVLLDGEEYSLNDNSKEATITIPKNDQDKIKFAITFETLDPKIFEDPSQGPNTGRFKVTINPLDELGGDLEVSYAFINGTAPNFAVINDDFSQNGTGILVFKSGEPNSQEILITALQDPLMGTEDTETITLALLEGNKYNAAATANATMEIISAEFNADNLPNNALQATVFTNTCADSNEGDISIKNSSQLDFDATINPGNMSMNLLGNSEVLFKNLASGTYTVSFSPLDPNSTIIPPSFRVTIQELSGTNLIGQAVDVSSKTAKLVLSGSRKYYIENNNGSRQTFEFSSFDPQSITVPLSGGENKLTIKGEAACQGVVNTSLYLNQLSVFPNPTSGLLQFTGFLKDESSAILIADFSGKSVLNAEQTIKNGILLVNISHFDSGAYYGTIKTTSGQSLTFKVLKK